jgi:ABC-type spermidine/putrescine transport system permease subunit I
VQGHLSKRIATCRYVVFLAMLGWLAPAAALGDSTACSPDSTSLECRLLGFLHWLEAAAFVLVILLLIVIGIAIYLFRKNRLSSKGSP